MLAADVAQWPRLSALLDELLELDAPARQQRLVELRLEDADAAQALAELLGRLTSIEREDFLQRPAAAIAADMTGQTVGPYVVERELGQGGMGSVWLARRTDGRYEGRVAVKFLSLGIGSRGAAERFAREGSLLGRLSHPHIARLIDAGVLHNGTQPYLILEYVDGEPIDRYCESRALGTADRVRLFLDVLGAVAHAHNRLILHRDIKPPNILVSAGAEVKLLDFGIAKLLDDATAPSHSSELTRDAGRAFTPQYAAPEQIEGGDVTTATDVYALGVLLYVLLSGTHPTSGAADTPLHRMRGIVETEPKPMSARLSQAKAGDAAVRRLARELGGDLDTIVAKALKKGPAERYANAADMARDLQHYLANEPIGARRDSTAYRLGKFARRHRAGLAAAATTALALATGLGVALWQAQEARHHHGQAEGLIEYMLGDLRGKLQPLGRLDVLDSVGNKALAYYAAQDAGHLDAASLGRRSRALHLIGEIAELRGNLAEATRIFRRASDSTGRLMARYPDDGQRVFDHAQSVFWVGYIEWRQGRLPPAEQAFRRYETLARRLLVLDPNRLDWQAELAFAQQNLGTVLLNANRFAEARESLLQAGARLTGLLTQRPDLAGELANNHAWVARTDEHAGRLGAALDGLRSQIAILRAQPEAQKNRRSQGQVATALTEISRLELAGGRPVPAGENAQLALDVLQGLSGSDPANTLWRQELAWSHLRLADARRATGAAPALAASNVAGAAELVRGLLRQDVSVARWRVNLLGQVSIMAAESALPNQREAAIADLRAWLAGLETTLTDTTRRPLVAHASLILGDVAALAGRDAEARELWQRAAGQAPAADPPATPLVTALAAQAWLRLGEEARARTLFVRLQSTEFRHPVYADLQLRLDRAAGAAAGVTTLRKPS